MSEDRSVAFFRLRHGWSRVSIGAPWVGLCGRVVELQLGKTSFVARGRRRDRRLCERSKCRYAVVLARYRTRNVRQR